MRNRIEKRSISQLITPEVGAPALPSLSDRDLRDEGQLMRQEAQDVGDGHDGLMHTEMEYRCPECGALVWVPMDVELKPGRRPEVKAQIRKEEFAEAFERHVMFNPERHPRFVIATDEPG